MNYKMIFEKRSGKFNRKVEIQFTFTAMGRLDSRITMPRKCLTTETPQKQTHKTNLISSSFKLKFKKTIF